MRNHNSAEGVIKEVRRKCFQTMAMRRVPRSLWTYGVIWCSDIMALTHSSAGPLNSGIPKEIITGETENFRIPWYWI